LTHEGAAILATLIKVQALKRHNEAWKDSLRYGRPDLDSMFGIRRITINSNPQVKDAGVKALAEAFKSDLWLKALDLQDCGITTAGANELLDGLKFNAMMHVLDVRLNVEIERDTLQKIMEQVMINSSGNSTEYEWMDLAKSTSSAATMHKQPSTSTTIGTKLKKRRNTNASFSKKAQFNSSTMKMKRCKSTGSVILNKSPDVHNFQVQHQKQSTSSGIPWRTAARANRFRVSSSCAYRKINGDEHDQNDNEFDEYYDEENSDEFIHEEDEDRLDNETLDYKIKATSDRNLFLNNKMMIY
jgi:centrosomal protein CEP78